MQNNKYVLVILYFTSLLSPLVPIVAGWKTKGILWLYVIVSLFFDVAVIFLKRGLHVPHHPVTNLFLLVEFALVSTVFKKQLGIPGKAFGVLTALPVLYFLFDTLRDNLYMRELNTVAGSYFYFIFIIFSLYGFYKIITKQEILLLEESPAYWINVTFLIYASGVCLLFVFKDYLKDNYPAIFATLWGIFFLSLNVIKNLILAIAISKQKRNVA